MSIKSNKELSKVVIPNKEVISPYNVIKQKFTSQEKILFAELRENLVDLAISSGGNIIEMKLIY